MKLQRVAIIGDKNTTVENIQQKLSDLGYTSQKVTGYYGDITFNNVAYFQIVNNLTVTGWVDSATYDALIKKSANISEGYFECNDETFSKFDITALEFPGSEYINVVVDMLGGKELLNEIGQQILDSKLIPSYSDYAAHHIVPEHETRAENARKILKRCGIDPNDAVNGLLLSLFCISIL